MKLRWLAAVTLAIVSTGSVVLAFQRGFGGRQGRRNGGFGRFGGFDSSEARTIGEPTNYDDKTEWAFARLQYTNAYGGYGYGRRGRGGGSWSTDYPKADRQFVIGVQRLTRLHARYLEEVVSPDEDRVFEWPWIYAVEVGHWTFTDDQAERMREFLLKGGFLMVDDFHGDLEWEVFLAGMQRIFPERSIEELEDNDPLFHVIYDIPKREERLQVPNRNVGYTGITYEKGGIVPHWRGIRDDDGRVMVAICFNQDNGDAWEWADDPRYPEKYASQAYRLGVNYIVYAMTH